jgi:hypothetical protein
MPIPTIVFVCMNTYQELVCLLNDTPISLPAHHCASAQAYVHVLLTQPPGGDNYWNPLLGAAIGAGVLMYDSRSQMVYAEDSVNGIPISAFVQSMEACCLENDGVEYFWST